MQDYITEYGERKPNLPRAAEDLWDQVRRNAREVEIQIARYPLASLGVALALGVIVGWLIKRR